MAENLSSASPIDGPPAPALHLTAMAQESIGPIGDAVLLERFDAAPTTPRDGPRPWHSTCAGKVTWMTVPDREVSQCVLPRGHRGDHRDAGGYPWNEGRWAD